MVLPPPYPTKIAEWTRNSTLGLLCNRIQLALLRNRIEKFPRIMGRTITDFCVVCRKYRVNMRYCVTEQRGFHIYREGL